MKLVSDQSTIHRVHQHSYLSSVFTTQCISSREIIHYPFNFSCYYYRLQITYECDKVDEGHQIEEYRSFY